MLFETSYQVEPNDQLRSTGAIHTTDQSCINVRRRTRLVLSLRSCPWTGAIIYSVPLASPLGGGAFANELSRWNSSQSFANDFPFYTPRWPLSPGESFLPALWAKWQFISPRGGRWGGGRDVISFHEDGGNSDRVNWKLCQWHVYDIWRAIDELKSTDRRLYLGCSFWLKFIPVSLATANLAIILKSFSLPHLLSKARNGYRF